MAVPVTAEHAAGPTGQHAAGATGEYACARAWAALTAAHARVTERLSAALHQDCGLSINDFELLLRLDQEPGPGQRLGRLNAAVRLTQPSLSRAVTRLENQGWVRRSGSPGDGRGVLVCITAAGRDRLRTAVPVHVAIIGEFLLDQLTPDEQDVLTRTLSRVAGDGGAGDGGAGDGGAGD